MTKRIDNLAEGSRVTLRFHRGTSSYDEPAVFQGIEGTGDDRRAKFVSAYPEKEISNGAPAFYEWEAYRYNRRWAYGTGADRLQLIS